MLAGWGRSGLARTPFCRSISTRAVVFAFNCMVPLAKLEKGEHRSGGIRPAYMRVSSYTSYYEGRLINVKSSRGRRGGFAETSARQTTCRRTARRRRGRFRRERLCGRDHDGNCCACRGAYRLVVSVLSLQGSTRRHVGAKLY